MAENIEMPQEVASDPVQAAIWEQLTARRTFAQEDAPTLALLCYWHAVANQAREAMALGGNEIEILDATAYKPIRGKGGKRLKMMRKNPALTVLKEGVNFGSEGNDPVRLLVTLAASDSNSHVETIAQLAELFMNEEDVAAIMAATSKDDILRILARY